MNKYEILENKLIKISKYINTMQLENDASMTYLKKYKEYVDKLIIAMNVNNFNYGHTLVFFTALKFLHIY